MSSRVMPEPSVVLDAPSVPRPAVHEPIADQLCELYDRYFDRVYGYLSVMLGDTEAAEGLVQDVFVSAFDELAAGKVDQSSAAWLFAIARGAAINRVRTGQASAVGSVSDSELAALISDLPLLERDVLVLHYQCELSFGEIAEVLQNHVAAVARLHHWATESLRSRIAVDLNPPAEAARRA